MSKTNFDQYLEQKLADPAFAERFEHAGSAWEVSLQIADLRRHAGLSQAELAARLETTQKQISRLESPGYEGHSLRMLRRLANELDAELSIALTPRKPASKQEKAAAAVRRPAPRRARKLVVQEPGGTYKAAPSAKKKKASEKTGSRSSKK